MNERKNSNKKNTFYPKVLFTTGLPRTFRASNIAHLYEISQVYPVILLSEEFDPETEKILHNKKLFPKLKEIIPYRQFTGQRVNLFSPFKNYYFYKLAKDVINRVKPDILIAGDDYLFQLYLSRFAKKIKLVLHIAIQGGLRVKKKDTKLWSELTSAYLKAPSFLPFPVKILFIRVKNYLGHFFYYWILPLLVGELPFRGKSSFILREGDDAMRACDYSIVYSKRDYNLAIENGVPPEKLYVLTHPLARKETKEFFERTLILKPKKKNQTEGKTVTLLLTDEPIGVKREDLSLISRKERKRIRLEIINSVFQILKDWKIFIKPHPDTRDITEIKKTFEAISDNIKVTDPSVPVDKYVKISNVIIEFPRSISTVLSDSSLLYPEKPIISLDLHHEFFGDVYKDFDGIEYIDDKEKFINLLREIRDNKFLKKKYEPKTKLEQNEFSSTVEVLEHLINKKLR